MAEMTARLKFDGRALRALREGRGWTLEYVAGLVGVTRGAVHQWETGRNTPSFSYVAALANLFGVSTEKFRC
jgi:transcriptional regulator with XRE-family HTH domain